MFRTLYIFVAIHILRGCPKTIPSVDDKSIEANVRTLNSTSLCVFRETINLLSKISPNMQSGDTVYTGLGSASASAQVQSNGQYTALNSQTSKLPSQPVGASMH
ncbi:hypothetical protein SprV_0200645700 [Sparganum proliferum]